MASKLPAFQFYPGDWRKDIGVQSLSFHDRGVWWEMLCLMHESEERGMLVLNGMPMSDEMVGRLLGLDKQIATTTITTLLTTGVACRDEVTGALMSRRMVRDEKLRQTRTQAGKMGGNPVLVKQNPTTGVKQNPTPSSSSSVSSSTSVGGKETPPLPDPYDPNADPEENIPDGLALVQYAGFIAEQAKIPAGYGLKVKIGDAVKMLADLEGCGMAMATGRMLKRIRGMPTGEKLNFWLDDGGWKQTAGISTEGW